MQRTRHHIPLCALALATTFAAAGCSGDTTATPPAPSPTPQLTDKLYVSEGNLGQVAVLDPTTGDLLRTIAVGRTPTKLSYNYATKALWVANSGDDTVSKIDTVTDKVVGTVHVGADPEWVDATPSDYGTDKVAVANRGDDTVSIVSSAGLDVTRTVPTAGQPLTVNVYDAMVAEANGKVEFLGDSGPQYTATVTNGLQGAAESSPATDGSDLAAFYTAYDGKVSIYKPVVSTAGVTGLTSWGTATLPAGAGQIYAGYGSDAIVVNSVTDQVSVVNLSDATVEFTVPTGRGPRGAGESQLGKYYVANADDDTISVISPSGAVGTPFHVTAGAHPEDVAIARTLAPTPQPTASPTSSPTSAPTSTPTSSPTATPTATPTPAPTSTPASGDKLYVANGSGDDLLVFDAPFGAASTPAVTLTIGSPVWGVAVDASYVAVEDSTGIISVYATPLTASSTPVARFGGAGGSGGNLAFDSSGNLYTGTLGPDVLKYSPPFSNASTPAQTISGEDAAFSLAFDYAGTLYVGNIGENRIDAFASPYTGSAVQAPVPGTYGLATNGATLLGADATDGKVWAYDLPLTPASTPSFGFADADPHAVVFASDGTVFVGDQHGGTGNGTIDAFAQPLSASSAPAYAIPSSVVEPVQLAIGQ